MIGTILILSEISPEMLHPIVPHGNRVCAVHVHLNQVPFNLCWPSRYLINEKELIFFSFSANFQLDQCSEIFLYEPPWVSLWNWYHLLLFMIIWVFLVFDFFLFWLVITGVTIRLCIWPKIWNWEIYPPDISWSCSVCVCNPASGTYSMTNLLGGGVPT